MQAWRQRTLIEASGTTAMQITPLLDGFPILEGYPGLKGEMQKLRRQ